MTKFQAPSAIAQTDTPVSFIQENNKLTCLLAIPGATSATIETTVDYSQMLVTVVFKPAKELDDILKSVEGLIPCLDVNVSFKIPTKYKGTTPERKVESGLVFIVFTSKEAESGFVIIGDKKK